MLMYTKLVNTMLPTVATESLRVYEACDAVFTGPVAAGKAYSL